MVTVVPGQGGRFLSVCLPWQYHLEFVPQRLRASYYGTLPILWFDTYLMNTCLVQNTGLRMRNRACNDEHWDQILTHWAYNLVCVCVGYSVVSNSLQPPGLYSTRLLCPWDSLGKNTGVGCHSLLRGSSRPRDWIQVSRISDRFFTI